MRFKLVNSIQLKPFLFSKWIVIVVVCFSFVATSLPKKFGTYGMSSSAHYEFPYSKQYIIDSLYLYKSTKANYNYVFSLDDVNASIFTTISIEQKDSLETIIRLDSIQEYILRGNGFIFSKAFKKRDIDYLDNLTREDIERILEKDLKRRLGNSSTTPPNSH